MLLIHTQKITPRVDYAFKHICTRILGIPVQFTTVIETFIAHSGPKLSYGKQPMANELFIQSRGLLFEQGFDDLDISVTSWGKTIGFFAVSDKSALPFDIFSGAFYLLSRYEEYLPHFKDDFGRFPVEESIAYKEGFLRQPVIDFWAMSLKTLLEEQFLDYNFPSRDYNVHHLVEASRPFEFANRGFLRNFIGFSNDLVKLRLRRVFKRTRVLLRLRKDPFNNFTWIVNSSKKEGSKLSVFFLLGEGVSFREDLNTKRKRYKQLVKFVGDYTKLGLLFSYHSLDDHERLKEEKKQMEELSHRSLSHSMNDQFMVSLPNHYRNLLELEVACDCTMVYDTHLGFRAGTCTPFLFYDLDYEIKTPLIIQPIAGTTTALKEASSSSIEMGINELKENVKSVHGVFSFVFSNKDFTSTKKNKIWKYIFSEN